MLKVPTMKDNNFLKKKTTLMQRLFTRKGTQAQVKCELNMEEVMRSWTKIAGQDKLMLEGDDQKVFEKVIADIFED